MANHRKVIRGNKGEVLPGTAREIIFKSFESDKKRANAIIRDLNFASIKKTPGGILISDQLFAALNEFLRDNLKTSVRVAEVTGIDRSIVRRIKREGLEATADGHRFCASEQHMELKALDTSSISSDEEVIEEYIGMDSELELVNIETSQKAEELT